MIRRNHVISLALVVVLTLSLVTQAYANPMSAWSNGSKWEPWGNACTVSHTFVVQEFGKSRIHRFKVMYYITGVYGGPWFYRAGWYYSASFPNDAQNFYWKVTLPPGVFRFPQSTVRDYALKVKVVGMRRGGWFSPDVVRWHTAGTGGCHGFNTGV